MVATIDEIIVCRLGVDHIPYLAGMKVTQDKVYWLDQFCSEQLFKAIYRANEGNYNIDHHYYMLEVELGFTDKLVVSYGKKAGKLLAVNIPINDDNFSSLGQGQYLQRRAGMDKTLKLARQLSKRQQSGIMTSILEGRR